MVGVMSNELKVKDLYCKSTNIFSIVILLEIYIVKIITISLCGVKHAMVA